MNKILVTGASGLVGSRFIEFYKDEYIFSLPEYPNFDLTDRIQVKKVVREFSPNAIINFAAFTDVSAAENQRDKKDEACWKINVEGVKNLLNAVDDKVHFVQISTDMVFPGSDGDRGPYGENHKLLTDSSKLTWYGYTKSEAEKVARKKTNSTILRLIYPVRAKYSLKLDYLRKPLSLYDRERLYPMFNDQQISISFIDEIAQVLKIIVDKKFTGVYHASSTDVSTPYDLVSYLIEKARGVKNAVKASSLADFLKTVDNPVRYPKFGGLRVEETQKKLGFKFSSWKLIIDKLIDQGISV